ncbi:MAG: glycosyltransferase family 2 protein [Candidatus Falkowbacteria bacterium]|nr:glycosyltransferase family 2 protein [Candidatus Falkowbacteria bacterium]
MPKKIGIILINYQDYAARFLNACRDSLRAQDYPAEMMNIYIVDNASTSETFEYLKMNYPEARILTRPDGNYAAASNLGLNQAISDGCEYLVSVNMDTETTPSWLSELVKALDSNPEAAIAQSKILLFPRSEEARENPRINSLGNIIHFLGFGFTSGYGETDREIIGYPEIKGYASGCSFIIRAEVFKKVGGYQEEFYMYHDDLELSLKVRLAGYKIVLAPRSVIFHKYEFSRSVRMFYCMERNRYLTLLIFYPARLFLLVGLAGAAMDIVMFFYSIFGGWFKEELKIWIYFSRYSTYVKIRDARREIKKISVIKFSEIARNFSGRIEFQEIANPLLKYIGNPLMAWYWSLVRKII